MNKTKPLFALFLLIALVIASGCAGKSTTSENEILLIEKEPFRVTPDTSTPAYYIETVVISGFIFNSFGDYPDKVIISATNGYSGNWQILQQKELGPGESMQFTVWENSNTKTKNLTVNDVHWVIKDGNEKVAANVIIKSD